MKTERNEPGDVILSKGESWVRCALHRDGRKVGITQSDIDGVPLLGPKNIDTLTDWLAEAKRQIKETKQKRKEAARLDDNS